MGRARYLDRTDWRIARALPPRRNAPWPARAMTPPSGTASVPLLASAPRHIPAVARWILDQWGHHYPGSTHLRVEAELRTPPNAAGLPCTFVALDANDTPVGTASLLIQDMEADNPLTPWLASVFVLDAWRGRGIGRRLVATVEEEALRLGVRRLYLFTPDRETFYAHTGWRPIERRPYRGEDVVVMTKALG